MPNAVATYYREELINWDATLVFYNKESDELGRKLMAVIQMNTIPNRALAAENFLNQFALLRAHLTSLSLRMHQQKNHLQKDHALIEDNAITAEITDSQNTLRDKMKGLEKDFIDLKYSCYDFLSGAYKP